MADNKFTNEDLENLINFASQKMGVDKDKLKDDIKSGKINNSKANEILNDKEKLNALLNSPQVKMLINQLKNKNNNNNSR